MKTKWFKFNPAWLNLSASLLIVLLQRTPVLRTLLAAELRVAPSFANVWKWTIASIAGLGSYHSVAGATTNIVVVSGDPTTAKVGVPFSMSIASDNFPINSWSVSNLPPGITFQNAPFTGTFGGTPTTPGTYGVSVSGAGNLGVASTVIDIVVTAGSTVAPAFTTHPQGQAVAMGGSVTLNAAASNAPTFQWFQNGKILTGQTGPSLTITNIQPTNAGLYTAVATNSNGSVTSQPAIVGITIGGHLAGTVIEFAGNIFHAASGNTFDQFLLNGTAASITADPGQVSRISMIDLHDDIFQIEFSGPGTLTVLLDAASGPAAPVKYNQAVNYMKGRATVVLAGATVNTYLSIFSVGTLTAPGIIKAGETYDGHADLAVVAIRSADGSFAAIRGANAAFSGIAGPTGIYAPGVTINPGPMNIHDISAFDSATPYLLFGSVPVVKITGGMLMQDNDRAIVVDGIPNGGVQMTAGTSSHNVFEPAQFSHGKLERNGVDVTSQLTVNPP